MRISRGIVGRNRSEQLIAWTCRALGTIKTYSRQRARLENSYDTERPRKRICMDVTGVAVEQNLYQNLLQADEPVQPKKPLDGRCHQVAEAQTPSSVTAPSSSPQEERPLFSCDAFQAEESELSSPPSSPPSRLPSPVTTARKPTFSFLKRKRPTCQNESESLPLSNIAPNACRDPPPRAAKKAMRQMQIDLGWDVRKTCRICGMEYIPSVRADAMLHKDFCGSNVAGIEMSRAFFRDESLRRVKSDRSGGREKEEVIVVDRRSSQAVRNKVKKVLDAVNAELSAADIDDDVLWEPLEPESSEKQAPGKRKGAYQGHGRGGDRFKAFLYMIGARCVGFCLAEKISNALLVVSPKAQASSDGGIVTPSKSSSISVSTTAEVALLGIARIWISKSFRRRGLALDLLECARRNFYYGVEVPKNLVAFSQTTESGGRLAEHWFEATSGWHVY
ncbi:MAG: hypothetical protein Q9217_005155 [Psora testacea]